MKKKITMCKGLPAAGKSFWALEQVRNSDGKIKRVNKDDLRAMVDAGQWSRENEKEILHARNSLVDMWLQNGFNVICDDTNFAPEHENVLKVIADTNNADFEIKFFDIPLGECLERDAKRGDKAVGSKVICGMYEKYIKKEPIKHINGVSSAILVDLDGTLAHMTTRGPFDFTKVKEDLVDKSVKEVITDMYKNGKKIIIVSGRDDSCMDLSREWLKENDIHFDDIIMRVTGDKRSDNIIKGEIYEKAIQGKYNVIGVFDDRNSVVHLWRSLGLKCFQCDYGNF